jgi:hypothetical protein
VEDWDTAACHGHVRNQSPARHFPTARRSGAIAMAAQRCTTRTAAMLSSHLHPSRNATRNRRHPLMTTEYPEPTTPPSSPSGDERRPPMVDMSCAPVHLRVTSPSALLAAVPLLLKFRPSMSVVIIGTRPPRNTVRMTLRYDLPDPAAADRLVQHALMLLAAQGIRVAVAVGYGPEDLVAPVAAALLAADTDVTVAEFLRAENGLYWSYVCTDPGCCPPEGTPYTEADAAARVAAAAHADVRVLESREELAASVARDPASAAAMRRLTRQAERQLAGLTEQAKAADPLTASRMIAQPGLEAVGKVIARYRGGGSPLPRAATARLAVMLRNLRVRDDAWARMDPGHHAAHLRLWTDVTRLAPPGYVAAPAALLAFCAWQNGDGALANVALDRALADNPRYSMALLLREALDSGAPPELASLPMTPEAVAAAYDELDAPSREAHGSCDTGPCGHPTDRRSEPAPATA